MAGPVGSHYCTLLALDPTSIGTEQTYRCRACGKIMVVHFSDNFGEANARDKQDESKSSSNEEQ